MNKLQRQAITTAGFLAVVFAPMTAMAQGRGAVRSPIFIAVTFHSPGESKLGVDVAEALRLRMSRFFPQPPGAGKLRVVTREQINAQLTAAGYPADSAITTTDLRDLGKNLGAAETLEGSIKRTAAGVEARAKFYSLSNIMAAEVLPVVVEKDAGAAGRKLAELYVLARKELPDYERCRNGLINREIDAAIVAAKAALLQYDKGVLPRACLMSAYFDLFKQKKMPVDSAIRVAQEIMAIDADNELAIGILADSYLAKGDTAKAIEMNMKLYALNPANTGQAQTIISILASSGAPEKALTIVADLMKNNPGDAGIIETQWKLLQATKQWKAALAAGEEMIKFDSSRADTTFFVRQLAAAVTDSQPQLVLQYLGRATAKFPKNTRFWLGYSQELRKQGQIQQALDAAKKAIAIDPKIDNGYATVLSLYAALGQADSALAFAKLALKAGADTTGVGNALLTLLKPSLGKAQSSGARADMEEFYRMAATVDSIVPQPATAFYMSFAAYSIAASILQDVQTTAKTDRPKACLDLKAAADMMLVVDLNMPRGGRFDPPNAATILNASSGLKTFISETKKANSCK